MSKWAYGTATIAGLTVLTTLGGCWEQIDEGNRGVVTRFGKVTRTMDPGLNGKTPWIESVTEISIRQQTARVEKMAAYSKDQQAAEFVVSVNWRVPADRVTEVYGRFGSAEAMQTAILNPRILEQTKNIFGTFNAATSIAERPRLNKEVAEAITASLRAFPAIIDGAQVENIDFSDAYEQSVEARMLAEVEVTKIRQNAEREKVQAEITVTRAKAAADSSVAQATAEAQAIRLRGDAEAGAIKARGDALKQNPDLVKLTAAERWDGKLPNTMVPAGAVPFVQVTP